jgi:hypothetical protein
VRVAREPGPPPDRDCSARGRSGRVSSTGGKLRKKDVKRWRTGSKPCPENPTAGPTRVSDAHPPLPVTTSAAFYRNGDLDGPRGQQTCGRSFAALLFRPPPPDGHLLASACTLCLPQPPRSGKQALMHLRLPPRRRFRKVCTTTCP